MLFDREKMLKIWRESADLDPWTMPGPYGQWHLIRTEAKILKPWYSGSVADRLQFLLCTTYFASLLLENLTMEEKKRYSNNTAKEWKQLYIIKILCYEIFIKSTWNTYHL